MNDITFYGKGWEEYVYWQTQDRKTLKKINNLLKISSVMGQCREPENRNH